MTKNYLYFFLFLFVFECSLNPNSKFWTKEKKILIDKSASSVLLKDKKQSLNEFNQNFKITLPKNLKIDTNHQLNNDGFINFDADLYSSTICALNFSKPVIDEHTILIFDEFIINETWEQDEYRALEEFCLENNYTYNVLAISFFTKQVAVKILGI